MYTQEYANVELDQVIIPLAQTLAIPPEFIISLEVDYIRDSTLYRGLYTYSELLFKFAMYIPGYLDVNSPMEYLETLDMTEFKERFEYLDEKVNIFDTAAEWELPEPEFNQYPQEISTDVNTSIVLCQLMTDGHLYGIALENVYDRNPSSYQIVNGLDPDNQ